MSFIVPVYAAEKYLRQCVDSILGQTFRNIEIILVDDGSPDNCPSICDAYAQKDTRVKVIHQNNQGVSVARNRGIAEAAGEWICFVDADDYVAPNYAELVAQHGTEKRDFLLFSYAEDCAGKIKSMPAPDTSMALGKEEFLDIQKGILNRYHKGVIDYRSFHVSGPCMKGFKRETISQNHLEFPQGIMSGEDGFFNFCYLDVATAGVLIPQRVYYYRKYQNSVTQRYAPELRENFQELISRYQAYSKKLKSVYAQDWNAFVMSKAMLIVLQDYCHPDNLHTYKEKKSGFVSICEDKMYRQAIERQKLLTFPLLKRMVCLLIRHRCFGLLCLITNVQNKMLKMGVSIR